MNLCQIKQLWICQFAVIYYPSLECFGVFPVSLLVTQDRSKAASSIKLWNLKPLASNLSYNPNLICTYVQQLLYH